MKNEPVLTVTTISTAIVAALSLTGTFVDFGTVEAIVLVLFAGVTAAIARSKVTPTISKY